MGGRGFCVKVELELQAVTCPGVWLCHNGKVALRMKILNSKIESRCLVPAFPLMYNEKFRFQKLFIGLSTLAELQNSLEDEQMYTELVQWSSKKESSIVLATFETNLADLLYPAPCSKGLLTGSEVDLLMEPTKYFPGILAPKIEISTRTIIEEVVGLLEKTISGAHIINPKMINSKNGTCVHRKRPAKGIIRQRKVCHTQGKTQQRSRPSTDGTSSSPSSVSNNCWQSQIENCCRKSRDDNSNLGPRSTSLARIREISPFSKTSHAFENCHVCDKYKCYFQHDHDKSSMKTLIQDCEDDAEILKKNYDSSKYSRIEDENENEKWRPKSAPYESTLHDCPSSSVLRAKVKEVHRQDAKSNFVAGDTRMVDYFECERNEGRQEFYKNLEKFYKRMYKQAKIRAQEIDCS